MKRFGTTVVYWHLENKTWAWEHKEACSPAHPPEGQLSAPYSNVTVRQATDLLKAAYDASLGAVAMFADTSLIRLRPGAPHRYER